MMWSKQHWVCAGLLFGLWASPAVAQPHWASFRFAVI